MNNNIFLSIGELIPMAEKKISEKDEQTEQQKISEISSIITEQKKYERKILKSIHLSLDSPPEWTQMTVGLWLVKMGFLRYVKIFKNNTIDGILFFKLEYNDIKNIIDNEEDSLEILNCIEREKQLQLHNINKKIINKIKLEERKENKERERERAREREREREGEEGEEEEHEQEKEEIQFKIIERKEALNKNILYIEKITDSSKTLSILQKKQIVEKLDILKNLENQEINIINITFKEVLTEINKIINKEPDILTHKEIMDLQKNINIFKN